MKFDDVSIFVDTKIIFDSGTNGIAFHLKYLNVFKEIIQQNDIFINNECDFVKENYDDNILNYIFK